MGLHQGHVLSRPAGTPSLAEKDGGIWDCTRAIQVPALPAQPRWRILAHEAAYWLRVAGRFVWILVTWYLQLLRVRIFHPAKYRRWQAFMRGEMGEDA